MVLSATIPLSTMVKVLGMYNDVHGFNFHSKTFLNRFEIYERCPMVLWQYPPMPIPMPMFASDVVAPTLQNDRCEHR